MIRRGILYLVFLLLLLYLFFMYNDTVLSGILVLGLLCPVFSSAYLAGAKKRLHMDLERIPAMGECKKRIRAAVTLENSSRFLSLYYEGRISVKNCFAKKKTRKKIRGVILPGKKEICWCEFETEMCGNVEFELESVRIYDPLGFFYINIRCHMSSVIRVMPEFSLMPVEITRKTREFQAEAEEYSGERQGDDPSELYQIREYRMQDSLRDIHWKLSAREEELMVRERGFPLGCVVLIWIDLPEGKQSAEGFSRLLSTAASLSVTLAEQKCIHMAAWYEEKNERIVKMRIRDEENAYELIWRLMEIAPYRDVEKKKACFEEAFKGQKFSSIVEIDREGVLRKDGEIPELLRV